MMKFASFKQTILILGLLTVFIPKSVLAELKTQLKLQGETLNFEILGQKSWDYDIKRETVGKQTKVVLKIKGLPEAIEKTLKLQANPYVADIKVQPADLDKVTTIEFFLKNENVEAFDYLTDQPSKLIVDFYANESAPVTAAPVQKNSKPIAKKESAAQPARKPADVDYLKISDLDGIGTFVDGSVDLKSGLFDGGDIKFDRFRIKDYEVNSAAILKGLTNYYLNFPMIDQEYSFWKKMKSNPPDYSIIPENTEENKQARLLLTLFQKKRPLVLKKTFDWFVKKYPESKYLDMAYLMTADALLETWKNDKSNNELFEQISFLYSQALNQFPKSPLAERTSLALGFLNIDRKNYLEASRRLNTHIENPQYKNNVSRYYAQLGLAYSLSKLSQEEEAIKLVNEIEEKSNDPLVKAEAAFRRADMYMSNESYEKAYDNYVKAIKKYDKLTALFPNAYYNKMEALFRLQKPVEAHKAAIDFVQNFPSHDHAPYALTRVGELLEIMGADLSKSTGAYLETHFRYGDSPRTIIARLHLQSTRMKGMKPLELEQTIQKMEELAQKSDLENVDQFKTTMIADGFARRNEYDKAIQLLTAFYQAAPNRKNSDQVTKRIVKNINDQIHYYSQQGEHKKALGTFKKYSDTWLKKQDRMDTDYSLAKAYEFAGAYGQAYKMLESVQKRLLALGDDNDSKFIKANYYLPLNSQINLAKANCLFNESKYQEASQALDQIKNPSELTEQDQIQRVFLASQIYEKKENISAAIRYLNEVYRTWKDRPQLVAPSAIKLAELEAKNKNYQRAVDVLSQLVKTEISPVQKEKALKQMAQIAIKADQKNVAIQSLNQLLNEFDKQSSLSEERYRLGELYFSQGEMKKAKDVWGDFKGDESGFWAKLANEKLNSSQWKDDYKKYLKRIPATAAKAEGELK